jgi:hypothetical protein
MEKFCLTDFCFLLRLLINITIYIILFFLAMILMFKLYECRFNVIDRKLKNKCMYYDERLIYQRINKNIQKHIEI